MLLSRSTESIDDYDETSGKVRRFAVGMNHNQPGDPEKLTTALVALVDAQTPPLRLALGTDTLKAIAEKKAYMTRKRKPGRRCRNRLTSPSDT